VARVKDREGLDDSQDTPCLEDRVPTPDIEILDRLSSEGKEVLSSEEDSNRSDSNIFYPSLDKVIYLSNLELEGPTSIIRVPDKLE